MVTKGQHKDTNGTVTRILPDAEGAAVRFDPISFDNEDEHLIDLKDLNDLYEYPTGNPQS